MVMNRRDFLRLGAATAVAASIPPSAYPQGSLMNGAAPVLTSVPIGGPQNRFHVGYREAVRGYEHVYPLLARAIKKPFKPLFSSLLFWDELGNDVVRPKVGPSVGFPLWVNGYEESMIRRSGGRWNAAQILRNPFGVTHTARASRLYGDQAERLLRKLRFEQLHQHLADTENVLRHGVRSRVSNEMMMRSTCGGIGEFGAGELRLRPLRDLCLLTNRQYNDSDTYNEEFLGEFTLQVV